MPDPVPGNRLPRYADDATILLKGRELNELATRIEEARPIPGTGIEGRGTPDGVELTATAAIPDYAPFAVIKAEPKEAAYELTFEPGRVICANPVQAANDGDGYDYFIPEIAGAPMDQKDENGELPKLTVSPGEGVFVQIERDNEGFVIPPVEISVETVGEDSDHYQPKDPVDDGTPSNYDLIRIVDVLEEDDELELKVWRKSDILLTPFLWTGENLGGHARPYKEHAEEAGVYRFRTIQGCWGALVEEDGDIIKVEAEAENIGDGDSLSAGQGAVVLKTRSEDFHDFDDAICSQKMKFRSLLQGAGADEKEIRITQEDEAVRVHGNGVKRSLIFQDCNLAELGRLEFKDGLLTDGFDLTIIVGDCPSSSP
jgi:hypothetical protein